MILLYSFADDVVGIISLQLIVAIVVKKMMILVYDHNGDSG
jgi:hypothetical protein